VAGTESGDVDRWLAILSGSNTWQDSDRPVTAATRALAAIQVLAVVSGAVAVVAGSAESDVYRLTFLVTALLVVCVGPIRLALGVVSKSRSFLRNASVRVIAVLGLLIGIFGVSRGWSALLSWPFGISLGCDAAITSGAIGWRPSSWQWWSSIVTSPIHLGVLGGLAGYSWGRPSENTLQTVLPIYATTHLWFVVSCVSAWFARHISAAETAATLSTLTEAADQERRRSAHWLHDEVCANLRLVTLTLQNGSLTTDGAARRLEDLDFALRLRQLEELLESGEVHVAEVLQPFLRNAQSHGVVLDSSPTYETASKVVSPQQGYRLQRAAGVLISNALNAGAGHLSVAVEIIDDLVQLSVFDDAGGFDTEQIAPGRGLWALRDELGAENLTFHKTDVGTHAIATVRIRRQDRYVTPIDR
jgi:signal transduction histidine kinase